MSDFVYQDLLPLGADTAPYRKLTSDYVSTFEGGGQTFLKVEPEAIRLLTAAAIRDISHLLRPGHLAQLRKILDDPEASANDRFVALDLLKNASIAVGESAGLVARKPRTLPSDLLQPNPGLRGASGTTGQLMSGPHVAARISAVPPAHR